MNTTLPVKRSAALSAVKKTARKAAKVVAKKALAKKAAKAVAKKAPAKKAPAKKAPAKKAAKAVAKKAPSLDPSLRLLPGDHLAVVRMYRTGHGDCFLIAFAGDDPENPVYVLIDCGYKGGSAQYIDSKDGTAPPRIDKIIANLYQAIGGTLDVTVVTHEHEDHVNGITEGRFEHFKIAEAWYAWTEDPDDKLANTLRKQYHDQLLGLLAARNELAADQRIAPRLNRFLSLELGSRSPDSGSLAAEGDFDTGAATGFAVAGADLSRSRNKVAMDVFKKKEGTKTIFLTPHRKIERLPRAEKVRVFVLGPPKDGEMLKTLDPEGDEEFHGLGLARSSASNYFAAAAKAVENPAGVVAEGAGSPFSPRYRVPWSEAENEQTFFSRHYGAGTGPRDRKESDDTSADPGAKKAEDDAAWRRIDKSWLYSALQLALNINNRTNNTSLVLAFELGKGGKVLLFAADAQRGNWLSWAKKDWKDGDSRVDVRDLMARTVLYKAGHHCSHNGTLNGRPDHDYANISWLAAGPHGDEFVAMITAVRDWAETQDGWDHPFAPIKDALKEKAKGRVFQTDTNEEKMRNAKPEGVSSAEWKRFMEKSLWHELYFDHFVS